MGAPSAAAKVFERLPTLAAVTSSVGGAGQVPASRLRMSSRALSDLTGSAMNEGRPERMGTWQAALLVMSGDDFVSRDDDGS